ncbi:MAG: PIG-L family deacetylase, partial [Polaromonas sp.]|nr:PIG-L family deacetylase [Polaromonas sp.]
MGAVALDSLPGPRIGPLGTPERDWTEWLAAIPRRQLDAFLPANGRLVVLAPHPDDEILACAGMLALHGARGGASLIIAATDGDASHAGCSRTSGSRGSDRNPAASLGQVRRSESADGLRRLALQLCAVLRLG